MPLYASELKTLRALLERLIPADDYAGALEAGVDHYVMTQLGGACAHEAAAIAQGLEALAREVASKATGRTLDALPASEAEDLLREIESGAVSEAWGNTVDPKRFIGRLAELAAEGFYADPGNGGNRGEVSWRMIGYQRRRDA